MLRWELPLVSHRTLPARLCALQGREGRFHAGRALASLPKDLAQRIIVWLPGRITDLRVHVPMLEQASRGQMVFSYVVFGIKGVGLGNLLGQSI